MSEARVTIDSEGNAIQYKGFPFLSNIDMYVQNELANRSLDRVRAIVPYIKVTPGFSPDGDISKKIVMKGIEAPNDRDPSTYEFNELYRPDSFYRPLAGIKSVGVDYKNAYGSIRKASISWICHTLEDLERLSPFFLNPGYSLFIEWGWSNWAKDVINNDPPVDLSNYFQYGVIRQKQTNGNYDCMLGIVTNYSFTMNRDGGFECTTEVISSGWLMEGMTTPNQFTQDATEVRRKELKDEGKNDKEIEDILKSEGESEKSKNESIKKTLSEFLKTDFYSELKNNIPLLKGVNEKHDYFILIDDEKNADTELVNDSTGEKIKDGQSGTGKKIEKSRRAAVYASWGYLEDYVLNPHITISSDDNRILFGFDSRDSKLSYHKHLRTTNLGVCILPPGNQDAPLTPDVKKGETNNDGYNFAYARRILINVDFFRETMLNSTTVLDGVLNVWSEINNACINFWTLKLRLHEQFYDNSDTDENKDSNQHVQGDTNWWNENKSVGKYYSPSYVDADPLKSKAINKFSIIDINYSDSIINEQNLGTEKIYMFRTKAFRVQNENTEVIKEVTSVIKNLTFSSNLSSMAALNVFYSAQNSDGRILGAPQTNTFRSLYDYSINGEDYSKAKDTFSVAGMKISVDENKGISHSDDKKTPDPGTTNEIDILEQSAYPNRLLHFLPYREKGYWVRRDPPLTGIEGMKMGVLLKDDNNAPATSTALVPLVCDIELEGISGIRIGNIFTIDHLPKIYQDKGVFQIIGITETVDKNAWTTKLKSQFRVFNNVNYVQLKTGAVTTQTTTATGQHQNIKSADKSFVLPQDKLFIREKLRQIWTDPSVEGFIASEQILQEAEIIILHESSWKQNNFNVNSPDDSYGLFQINMIKKGVPYSNGKYTAYNLYGERIGWTELGIIPNKKETHPTAQIELIHHNLWDVDTNIKVAKRIFKNYGGKSGYSWSPWSTRIHLAAGRQTTSLRNEIKFV